MKSVKFVLIILTVCAVNIIQTYRLKIDTMDIPEDRIILRDTSWPEFSTGILKSHSGERYRTNTNKTLILSAPRGFSIFAAVRLLDLRPNQMDDVTLFANKTAGPKTFSNVHSYKLREYDINENLKTFYAPDGQLAVNFFTGPDSKIWGLDGFYGFELLYTVQGNGSKCGINGFNCFNGACISKHLKCDRHNHCGDRSDQEHCFYPDPIRPNGSVAGIVGGVVFLLIAVACIIYIMLRRASRRKVETRRIVNQHPPPANTQGYPPPYSEPGMVYPPPPPPYSPYQGVTNPAYK